VVVKGTSTGTITDLDGAFTLNTERNKILVVSFIGYSSLEVPASQTMNIVLKPDNQVLDEVVVVGYGSSVKKDLTTAVTSVKSKDFLQGASNSPLQMVDGKVAGLSVSNPAAADPNRSTDIQVRGASSLKAGNGPLIVIDGMPGGDLRNLAQQDIESITVLKDGSAAAIYGSRAANGVILVQTKQGKAGKVSISYDGYVEHDAVAARPDILSPEEFVAKNRAKDWGSRTNWYDQLINDNNFGQFIFPKSVLADKGIITRKGKEGKRGIRVYPPWDKTTNKQAEKTQTWQTKYFLTIKNDNSTDLDLTKKLLTQTIENV
jgi:TonB-dependent SusC/RagA subfamily outer membrane receptor